MWRGGAFRRVYPYRIMTSENVLENEIATRCISLSSHLDFRSSIFLAVSGVGIITGPPGFDPTAGEWAFTSQSAGGHTGATFSFSANTVADVPDNGMTLALLGAGMVGLAAFRAKFAKV